MYKLLVHFSYIFATSEKKDSVIITVNDITQNIVIDAVKIIVKHYEIRLDKIDIIENKTPPMPLNAPYVPPTPISPLTAPNIPYYPTWPYNPFWYQNPITVSDTKLTLTEEKAN